jgi:hypothetical protein
MKNRFVLLAALAAFTVAPIASQASDKEVVKGHHYAHACTCGQQRRQVALFVSGSGVGTPASPVQSVTQAQVGQGVGVTFFTGER